MAPKKLLESFRQYFTVSAKHPPKTTKINETAIMNEKIALLRMRISSFGCLVLYVGNANFAFQITVKISVLFSSLLFAFDKLKTHKQTRPSAHIPGRYVKRRTYLEVEKI